jgi:hypothetical protein
MWETGRIAAIDGNTLYEYHVKVYDEPSEWGLNGGKISKLTIRKLDCAADIVNFDRGWDKEVPDDSEVQAIYNIILEKYN